jgi:hypothetical protein
MEETEKMLELKQRKARKDFVRKKQEAGYNQINNQEILSYLQLLKVLIDEKALHGIELHKIVKSSGLSKITSLKRLKKLREEYGAINREGNLWVPNRITWVFYNELQNQLGSGWKDFNPAQFLTFKNKPFELNNSNLNITGSVFTTDITKEKDINKILNSGKEVKLIVTIKPAGGKLDL